MGAAEEVSDRLKEKQLAGSTVTLKLKTADFRIRTRARSLESPTQLAGKIFAAGRELLAREIDGTRYRLIGVGVSALADADDADPADLIDRAAERRAAAEHAIDRVRGKFGHEACQGAGARGGRLSDSADAHATDVHAHGQGLASFISSEVISPLSTKSP